MMYRYRAAATLMQVLTAAAPLSCARAQVAAVALAFVLEAPSLRSVLQLETTKICPFDF